MVNRKDDPTSAAPSERPPHEGGGQPADEGNPAAQQAANITKASRPAARDNTEAVEKATDNAAQFSRRASDLAAQMADRSLRQAAEIGRKQSDQTRGLLGDSGKVYRDVTEHSREDFDAILQSGSRFAKGLQEMSWEVSQFTQQSVRLSMRLANDLLECRSFEDMVACQREFVKESMDVMLAESARILSLSTKVTNDAVNPLSQRAGNSFDRFVPEPQQPGQGANRGHENGSREYRH